MLTSYKSHPGENIAQKHKTTEIIWSGRSTTRYNVYPNQLNRLYRVEEFHQLKSRHVF